jgi:hypothetical protein
MLVTLVEEAALEALRMVEVVILAEDTVEAAAVKAAEHALENGLMSKR